MKPIWGLWYFALPLVCAWESSTHNQDISGVQGNTDGGLDPWLILSVPLLFVDATPLGCDH